jgi:hypothetical protein
MILHDFLGYLKDNAIIEISAPNHRYVGAVKDLFYFVPSECLDREILRIIDIDNKLLIVT